MDEHCRERDIQSDYLVNNAGFGSYQGGSARRGGRLQGYADAITTLTTLVAHDIVAREASRILNVGSTPAFQPVPHMAVYGASKAYVLNFTEALHVELKGTGVTATVLSPGVMQTAFLKRADIGRWGQAQSRLPPAAVAKAGST